MHYKMGSFLRAHYSNFITGDPKEVKPDIPEYAGDFEQEITLLESHVTFVHPTIYSVSSVDSRPKLR